ncbi:MAG: family 10 glycosylhydrolase [Clostridia bacterium]|nr:family 10 glycosylhydrolase [Clostridia bacterium]
MFFRRTTLIAVLVILAITLSVFSIKNKEQPITTQSTQTDAKFLGVWINYIEFAHMIEDKNEEQYQEHISGVLKSIKDMGFNTVVLHIRSHCDAFYRSNIFPYSSLLKSVPTFDPLEIFLEIAHEFNLSVHGWINPYRVAKAGTNITYLSEKNPARSLYNEGCVSMLDSGMYFIPSETKVQKLIIDGVREIIKTYPIDGIHFDDYFYPTTSESFDKTSYENYKKSAGQNAQSLGEFRRSSVNSLLFSVYRTIKLHNENILFGVSPSADIEKNYSTLYADASHWINGGYVDYICPQLYFGFEYPKEKFRFHNLLTEWEKLCNNKVNTVIGLAAYKSGEMDAESDEWIKNNDILSRQSRLVLENKDFFGICVYNYSTLISAKEEQEKLSKIICRTP